MKIILLLALLLAAAESHLEFDYSHVYDMNDFKGTPNYPIKVCEPGCRVYLTYINEAPQFLGDKYLADFTIELDDRYNITFYDLNRLELNNGEKGYYEIPAGTSEFIVHNPNNNGATRPLALWVVLNTAPMLDSVMVFQAEDKAQIRSPVGIVVLMSIAPFTVKGTVYDTYDLIVKTSPFDMLDNDDCEYVVKFSEPTTTFSQSFNSPIITIALGSFTGNTMLLSIDDSYTVERSIDSPGYLASPGYIGCANKTFVFRSESYNDGISSLNETFLVDGEKVRHLSFYGDINTDDRAPILLYNMDSNGEPLRIVGNQNDNTSTWEYAMDTSSFSIHWDSWNAWRNESFMIRYEVGDSAPQQSTTLPIKTTDLPKTTSAPSVSDNYCNCGFVDDWFDNWNPADIWVDVIIILDTSQSMGKSLEEAKSVITSFVAQMSTDINAEFYSRIGVIAMSDTVEVIYNLNMSSSDDLDMVEQHKIDKVDVGEAFEAALKMFADGTKTSSYRENAQQIIYYLTNSAPGANMNGVDDFKTNGGIIVVNDYVLEGDVADPGLQKLASDNFFFTDLSENYIYSLGVFCEANCFCSPDDHSFNDDEKSPRTRANRGCFHPVNNGIPQPKARQTCQKESGSLVSIHDSEKEFFVNGVVSVFGPKKKFWLGLENDGTQWNWDDNSTDSFTDWDVANGQPNTNGGKFMCAYAQQASGFNTPWTAANCAMGGVIYVCEYPPCSIGYKNC